MTRAFALLRSTIVSILFLSIWTWFVPRWLLGPLSVQQPAAWAIVGVGLLIAGKCAFDFAWHGRGTPAPFDAPRRLVVTGLYRYVRNPMYMGLGITLLGEALLLGRVEIAGEMLVLWGVVAAFVIFYEERALLRTFGDEYRVYCSEVPRWIPRLTPFDNNLRRA